MHIPRSGDTWSSDNLLGVLLEVSISLTSWRLGERIGRLIFLQSFLQHRGGGRGEAWWGLDDLVISGSYTTRGGEGDSNRRAQLDQTQERRCQVWV